jgi:LEA14-like dessication related protein
VVAIRDSYTVTTRTCVLLTPGMKAADTFIASMIRLACLSVLFALATGCHTGRTPELRVLGVHEARDSHVFVQVRNPASRPMRLTRLQYTFASAAGTTVSKGDVALERDIPAGSTVVVEVPLEMDATEALHLEGRLTAELDQYVRTYTVEAQIQPH